MTHIYLTNTLSRQKELFTPIDPQHVRMYVCGITPYDFSHIGHARANVTFDVLFRLLAHVYGVDCVTYVRNFTDVDDKIIQRAQEVGEDALTYAHQFIEAFHQDMNALNCLSPNYEPLVTETMADIITFVEILVAKGIAYVTESGDVNYDISRAPEREGYRYGALSGKKLEELVAGARVDVNSEKRHAGDFALWKAAKPGEPAWPSPWGDGRPGWHIECSAMSKKFLGDTFDIHGGGEDLQFPHHENEIAQSEGECGHQHVHYWVHNGFITVEGRKMSKSLGNFTLIRDVLNTYSGLAVRLWLLQTHYRKPVDYSSAALDAASKQYKKLSHAAAGEAGTVDEAHVQKLVDVLADDMNTAKALAWLNGLRKPAVGGDLHAKATLRAGMVLLGLWP